MKNKIFKLLHLSSGYEYYKIVLFFEKKNYLIINYALIK